MTSGRPKGTRPRASTLYQRPQDAEEPRERIIRTAYDLFCRHGIESVGVDRITSEAGVAKMTLYRHFRTKDALVVATLDRREQLWTHGWLEQDVARRAESPEEQLLAIFDALDDWFRRKDYEGCFFVNTLLEVHDPGTPVGAASVERLLNVRAFVRRLAETAGLSEPDDFAREWHVLLLGAIVSASAGEPEQAAAARRIGAHLLASRLGTP